MKDGSGDLDFGKSSSDQSSEQQAESNTQQSERQRSVEDRTPATGSEYPYFVRRNKVGDERTERLELHLREQVAAKEAEFRSTLAEQLGTDEVSKTDAREFALLAAFENPALVADLMVEEGYGETG